MLATLAGSGSAEATVLIATQLNGGTKILRASGATDAVWNGTVGTFKVAVSGTDGQPLTQLGSTTSVIKPKNKPAATLDIWITDTNLPSLTGFFDSTFTENIVPAGWTITERTYYSAANATYGGTLLASNVFSTHGTADFTSKIIPLVGPYSVTHQYHLAATTTGGTALSTISLTGTSVPEPASWAMMIGGFGLAGAAFRRRPAKALSAY
jgi:hypothetical protein